MHNTYVCTMYGPLVVIQWYVWCVCVTSLSSAVLAFASIIAPRVQTLSDDSTCTRNEHCLHRLFDTQWENCSIQIYIDIYMVDMASSPSVELVAMPFLTLQPYMPYAKTLIHL